MAIDNLTEILSNHRKWLDNDGGAWANLQGANLQRAYLRGADLQGANLDFSCFPLCCGGSHFKCDAKLVRQLFAHICTLDIVDADEGMKAAIKAILPEAKKSHRAEELEVE